MSRIALDLGFIQIYWYSIFIFLGVLVGSLVVYFEVKKRNIDENFLINLIFYIVLYGIIGARAYYVAFNLDYYSQHQIEILEIWNGGLAIHGGILAGLLVTVFYCKKGKQKLIQILDILVVGLIIGQAIGRWGNFFNSEAYGAVVSLETLQSQGIPGFVIQGMYIMGEYHQPTFLYESIWNMFGFFAMLMIRHFYKYLKTGQLTGFYLMWYSSARFVIEGMRLDSLMLGEFRIAQLVSVVLFVIGFILFIIKSRSSNLENLYNRTGVRVNESNSL